MTDEHATTTSDQVEAYYDEFSSNWLRYYVRGNRRLERLKVFLRGAIPPSASRVLVVGCGSGYDAHHIAAKLTKTAQVLGVDISSRALTFAGTVYRHPRLEFRHVDIINDAFEGEWDVIVFPDSYEHMPLKSRGLLHSRINNLLDKDGIILLTVPSPEYQKSLKQSGQGLQIVDEIVTLDDLKSFADDVSGSLIYFATVSIWKTHDYVHAIIARNTEISAPIPKDHKLMTKGWPGSPAGRFWQFLRLEILMRLTRPLRWVRLRLLLKGLKSEA